MINPIAHIYKAAVLDAEALTGLSGTTLTLKLGDEFEIGGGGTEALTIGDHTIVTPSVQSANSTAIVHIIDGVLVPE